MPPVPHNISVTLTPRKVRLSDFGAECDGSVIVDSTNTDSGNTPTTRFREGNVVVKRASTGRFVEANDSNGDRSTAPSITSSGHTDATSTIKLVGNHGTISVTVTTGTGTEANCATDLNADAVFKAHYIATSGSGELTITARNSGSEEWFYMHADTHANYGFAEGEDNAVSGADADYRVTLFACDLVDANNSALHAHTRAARLGHFKASNLINLTAEARAVLTRRGSIFE